MPSAATAPVLQTLTYTATLSLGGGLYKPVGVPRRMHGTVATCPTPARTKGSSAVAAGTTTAFAGSLTAFGEHGDGGQATSASLYHPGGTAVDAKGDVFIADSGDNVVREVTAAGVDVSLRLAGHRHRQPGFAGPGRLPRPRSAPSTTPRTSPSTHRATCSSPTPTTTGSSRSPRRARS